MIVRLLLTISAALVSADLTSAQNGFLTGSRGSPTLPTAAFGGGRLASNPPGAGNFYVGGPSDAYQTVIAALDQNPSTPDELEPLVSQIEALRRADLGEQPYDVKLGLQLELLEFIVAAESELDTEIETSGAQPRLNSGGAQTTPEQVQAYRAANDRRNQLFQQQQALADLHRQVVMDAATWIRSHFSTADADRLEATLNQYEIGDDGRAALDQALAELPAAVPPLAVSKTDFATVNLTEISASPVRGIQNPPIIVSLAVYGPFDGVMVSRINPTAAFDNFDQNLLPATPIGTLRPQVPLGEPSLTAMTRAAARDEPTPLGGSINLLQPTTGAREIRLLEGTMEVYVPTPENGGVAKFPDFAAQPGQPLASDQLDALGIEIMPMNEQAYQLMQEELSFRGRTGFTPLFNFTLPGIFLYIRDPDRQLAGLVFVTKEGNYLSLPGFEGRSTAQGGELRFYRSFQPVPDGLTLVAYLYAPDTNIAVPFHFTDIPLN